MSHLLIGAYAALSLARSARLVKRAFLAAVLCLALPVSHAAARSIGTCYNGTIITVPAPEGGIVDLNPYGYSICTLTVSGATIYSRYGGAIISITGDHNNLEAEHHGFGHGHGRFQIIGNNNYVALGYSGGNIDVVGTGNVFNVWDTFTTEHFKCSGSYPTCGNKWVVQGRGGDWIWGANPNQGVQGLPNHDIFDLVMPLTTAGCGYGCDPRTLSRYIGNGPGNHIYDIPTLKGANGPVVYFFDCSGGSSTLDRFLANNAILPGPTPEIWPPAEPAEAIPPWPGGPRACVACVSSPQQWSRRSVMRPGLPLTICNNPAAPPPAPEARLCAGSACRLIAVSRPGGVHGRERNSLVKNRMRETCSSGSADADLQVPFALFAATDEGQIQADCDRSRHSCRLARAAVPSCSPIRSV